MGQLARKMPNSQGHGSNRSDFNKIGLPKGRTNDQGSLARGYCPHFFGLGENAGALVLQDLELGETLAPESFWEGDKAGGKHLSVRRAQTVPPEATSPGNRASKT